MGRPGCPPCRGGGVEDGGSNWCATYGDTMEAPGSLGKSVEQLHDFAQTIRARARATRTHGYAMERATATLWNTIGRAIFVARPSVSSPIWL